MNSYSLPDSRSRSRRMSLPLFVENSSIELAPGTLNDDLLVREVISESIKRSGKSRDHIAEAMAHLLGVPVTARMITSFTSESKELHRWPGAWDRAFCIATGNYKLLTCRVELAGFKVITESEREVLEIGRHYLRQKRAGQEIALLERQLMGVDL